MWRQEHSLPCGCVRRRVSTRDGAWGMSGPPCSGAERDEWFVEPAISSIRPTPRLSLLLQRALMAPMEPQYPPYTSALLVYYCTLPAAPLPLSEGVKPPCIILHSTASIVGELTNSNANLHCPHQNDHRENNSQSGRPVSTMPNSDSPRHDLFHMTVARDLPVFARRSVT